MNEWWFILSFWHRSPVISSFIGETGRGLGFASNLLTCPLVHLSTYHVTLSLIQATCSLIYSLTCPLTMLPIEVSKSHDKDKNWNVDPQNLFLTLIPQHYYKLNFLSTWATKSCSGFCHVRIFTYLSVAKKNKRIQR